MPDEPDLSAELDDADLIISGEAAEVRTEWAHESATGKIIEMSDEARGGKLQRHYAAGTNIWCDGSGRYCRNKCCLMAEYRILVTGSRSWTDYLAIENALHDAYFAAQTVPGWTVRVVVVHGACPKGADAMADQIARDMKEAGMAVEIERHPADWNRHGKSAGFIRNAGMVALGANLCLAFIKDRSRGATHCTDLAAKAGIEVRRFETSTEN